MPSGHGAQGSDHKGEPAGSPALQEVCFNTHVTLQGLDKIWSFSPSSVNVSDSVLSIGGTFVKS